MQQVIMAYFDINRDSRWGGGTSTMVNVCLQDEINI